ncbi:MAG: DNA-protecting protein DprA [Thermoleophilia bacterium]|nr:DNA-protecting protein DprA [Thermoleophilia bacterium]
MREVLAGAECWACCRHDEDFPEGLDDGADAPHALIGRGGSFPLAEVTLAGSVTVVGARRATGYGLEVARRLGGDLAGSGLTVVSGMALGIDGAAHRGALERGRAVAVLACGPDLAYPASHRWLYRRLVESGLVISEMPPGSRAWRWAFPARNRIMAALSQMTVVVEAARRSGSLITAEMAADAGREVGAVPGQVTVGAAAGTNELIASGAALVRDGRDVLDRAIGVGAVIPEMFGPDPGPGGAAVLGAVEHGCETVDRVADLLCADAAEVAGNLARLEVSGYLRCSISGTWSRTGLQAPYPSTPDGQS